jgi:hypothetical protein
MSVWENYLYAFGNLIWFTVLELFDGVTNERIDVYRYVYPGILVALAFVARVDYGLYYVTGVESFLLSTLSRELLIYSSLLSGWVIWAMRRAFLRISLLNRLGEAFSFCKLESHGRMPGFIEDVAVDEHVRRMKLKTQGIPLKEFQDAKDKLESQLNISIVKFSDDYGDKSRINILYAFKPLATQALLDGVGNFKDGVIPVGISHEGPVTADLRELAHILIAGQTTGGKSNFEKVAASTLVANCPDAEIVYLDFKGGMEIADLINKLGNEHRNFSSYASPTPCARYLAQLGPTLEARFREIARLGTNNLDDYLKKREIENSKEKALGHEAGNKDDAPKRTFIILDEIAELYSRNPILPKEELAEARAAVNRIARQGRAGGVHLIVATQKPDVTSFDQTLKANMPAVLCFPMTAIAASISALGTKRAVDLDPAIKGRAVWKYGPKTLEVQTYLFQ